MKRKAQSPRAFSLVEITIALGVMSFSILSIIGLLPVAMQSNQKALEQTAAANICKAIAADLGATPLASSTTCHFGITLPAPGQPDQTIHSVFLEEDMGPIVQSGSSNAASPPATARYRATIGITAADLVQKRPTVVRILVTWPALASDPTSDWPKNFAGSYETLVYLNRNN